MASDDERSSSEAKENQSQSSPPPPQGGWSAVSKALLENRMETALYLSRGFSLYFALHYFLPFFAYPESSFQKLLMSNAITSGLRLSQRVGTVSFTREFVTQVLCEDSAHYLIYSLVFISCAPITIVLIPIILFAILHFASRSLGLLNVAGENNALGARFLISLVEFQNHNILRSAAFFEIILLPITVYSVFAGRVNLATPFIYYQFLVLRYSSRRNPYTRNMFHEISVFAKDLCDKPYMPAFVKSIILKAIDTVERFAPPIEVHH